MITFDPRNQAYYLLPDSMHELSLALNIVEIATEEMKKVDDGKILSIELEVGTLSGVVIDALEFALEVTVKGTILEGARVDIHQIDARAICNQCQQIFTVTDLFTPCPQCHSFDNRLIQGDELRLKSLLIE